MDDKKSNEQLDDQFDQYIELFRMAYSEKPKNTVIEMKKALQRLYIFSSSSNDTMKHTFRKSLGEISFFPFIIFIGIVLFSLIGFFQLNNYGMYFFGEVFFFAGLGVGLYIPAFGLIFLASHGGTGFAIMLGSLLSESLNSPIWSDHPVNLYLYFGLMILIGVIAVLLSIVHNLSRSMKKDKRFFLIIVALYLLVLFMSGIFPYIVPILLQFHL